MNFRQFMEIASHRSEFVREPDEREILRSAVVSWKGNPTDMVIHIKDAIDGKPVPPSASGKKKRAMAEALLRSLDEQGEPAPTLYRGDNRHPAQIDNPLLGWTENKKVAEHWAAAHGGKVYTLEGSVGVSLKKIVGDIFDDGEGEWIVRNDAKTIRAHLRESRQFMEMPLSSYRSRFFRKPKDQEGFGRSSMAAGGVYTGRQTYRDSDGGEHEIEGYFSQKDRAVITHPRTARTLEAKLAGSKYNFNILMLERVSPDPRLVGDYESRQVGEFIEQNNIKTEGHITFVKNGTSGHVMTPWMILHTLGHAAFAHVANERNIRNVFMSIINELADAVCGNEGPGSPAMPPPQKCMRMLGDALVFRSIRKDAETPSFTNTDELFHELVAEFLWNGDRIRVGGPRSGGGVPAIVRKLEDAVREVLDSCVGHVIFDYFG